MYKTEKTVTLLKTIAIIAGLAILLWSLGLPALRFADAANITTVTFEEVANGTYVTVHDLYPSKESLDEAIESGSSGAMPEQLEQLQQLFI